MNTKNNAFLSKIWDAVQMIDTTPNNRGSEIMPNIELLESQIKGLLNDEVGDLFQSYINLTSVLRRIYESDAFASGIRFVTAYLDKAKFDK